ncbi:MAG: EboA domain-containing protein [Planctomycetota bacterium]|jgi:hypothetical protein
MSTLQGYLEANLEPAACDWLASAGAELEEKPELLPRLFPQLPRRLGRETMGEGRLAEGDYEIDRSAWRSCDAGALELLRRAPNTDRLDLFQHGDMEERSMVLRSMAMLPLDGNTAALLGEIQRSNTTSHFEAGALDSNLVIRALEDSSCAFAQADFDRLMVKLAFSDLPLERVFFAAQGASPELSRMLQDLASEREAAGRGVWADTCTLIAHAPIAGSLARILGGLEHGDDRIRLAAIRGLTVVYRPELKAFVLERLEHEPRNELRVLLETLTTD